MRSSLDRVFLLFAFLQLGLEYHSLYLFLWPLNHSCAGPLTDHNQNLADQHKHPSTARRPAGSYAFNDSRKNPVDPNAIQTNLFDAYPDDPFTSARAFSMGIKYDDIAGCLQYRREFDNKTNISSVDLNQLETCPNGLHFEEPSRTISVVAFFRLACARKYLSILLPNSFALGFLFGIILSGYYLITRVGRRNLEASSSQPDAATGALTTGSQTLASAEKNTSTNLYYWFSVQIIAGLIILTQTYLLSRLIVAASVDDQDDHERAISQQRPELYGRFLCCVLLRSFIAASNLTRIVLMWPKRKKKILSSSYELFKDNRVDFFVFSAIFICFKALYAPLALKMLSSWWQLNEWLSVQSFSYTVAVFLRESLAKHNSFGWSRRTDGQEVAVNNQLIADTTNIDDSNGLAKEILGCEFCSLSESPISIVDNPYLPTTSQRPCAYDEANGALNDLWLPDNRVHQYPSSSAHRALPNRNLTIQLVMLTFCLSYNYFLFQMLPDHELLHSESTASRMRRKLSYAEVMSKEVRPDKATSYSIVENEADPKINLSNTSIFHDQQSFIDHASRAKKREFDFRSTNRATQSVDEMKNSLNPIELLWTTAKLYKWHLDLFVFALHLSCLSNFELLYFKLSRLFVLVELGAKFLALEWLLIGTFRRQNHLVEWDWLNSVCLLLSELNSSLMLFNYISTMLKLNSRLMTNRLMSFLPNTLSAILAFLVASYAPLLEWFDLIIIPVSLVLVNLMVLWLTRNLNERFKTSLCPMIFEDHQPNQPNGPAQRMILVEPS